MVLLRGNTIAQEQYKERSMAGVLYEQFNEFHTKNFYPPDVAVESEFYTMILDNIQNPPKKPGIPKGVPIFNPSGSDKCKRELYYRATGVSVDRGKLLPYHKRWTRNATLVHEGVQRDLLYMEKHMPDAPFQIHRMEDGRPAWEENIKQTKLFTVGDVQFGLTGMMDGVLHYKPTDQLVGFEFKTKSNSVAQVGTYKMKEPGSSHALQCTAYKMLFGLSDYILMYESVAKDNWMKGEDARIDIRTFHLEVTDEMEFELASKFADVARSVKTDTIPQREYDKCLFCQYKDVCKGEV